MLTHHVRRGGKVVIETDPMASAGCCSQAGGELFEEVTVEPGLNADEERRVYADAGEGGTAELLTVRKYLTNPWRK